MNMTEDKKAAATNSGVNIFRLEFEDVRPPVFRENKAKGFVTYGINNDYPEYLLGLFDTSGKHSAIVSGKAGYIMGKGFAFVDENVNSKKNKTLIDKANTKGETLREVFGKVSLDLEIFGGGYVEVIYNKLGKVSEVYHLDFTKMRASKDLLNFYFSEDWNREVNGKTIENRQVEPEVIPAFDPSKPKGKQVLYIREYRPKLGVYPKPNYFAALRYIQIDVCIGEYHLSGITNGMFASKLINFNNGVPEKPDQLEIEKKVNKKFAGSKNAGKIMLSFNKSGENAPTVLDLSGTELDKHFDLLEKTVEQQIFSSHKVTSGSLFGIKSDAVFANRNELRDAFELFQNTYISDKRVLIEKNANAILSINSIPTVYLQRNEPIDYEFSEATKARVMSDDEIREKLGLKPKQQETPAADSGAGTPNAFSDDLDDERDAAIFSKYGKKKGEFEIVDARRATYESDFQFYKAYFANVTELDEIQKQIIDLISKDPLIDPAALASALNTSEDKINGLLKGLESDGLITSGTAKKNGEEVVERVATPEAKDLVGKGGETTSIKIMYSYEGIKDDRNRPFCAYMLDLDHLYSREDIEAISSELGYSVWNRRGGWYKPQGADEARPYCRHYWQTNTVITKSK